MLRMFLALTVAIVSTFHVCGYASVQASEPTFAASVLSSGEPQDAAEMTVEKCHLCAVTSLPALMMSAAAIDAVRIVPSAEPVRLLSFLPATTAPPPRTLT